MTSEELRELADKLVDPSDTLFKFHMDQAAAYLRACADALEKGPVAWVHTEYGNNEYYGAEDEYDAVECPSCPACTPLYPLAMPAQAQPLRLPEPMTDKAIVLAGAPWHWNLATGQTLADLKAFARTIEAETLRRLKEANNAVVMLGALRLPEPMTDEEVDALIDETEGMDTDRAVRCLVETGERRVKEANK